MNLAFYGKDFLSFLEHPQDFVSGNFEPVNNLVSRTPHGKISDCTINFVHYNTLEEASVKWKARSQRILWDNIYIIATGHDGLETAELMKRFDKMPYKHKIMFTFGKWPQYDWAKDVKIAHGINRPFTEFATFTGKRFYETAFNLSKWIEKCEKEK